MTSMMDRRTFISALGLGALGGVACTRSAVVEANTNRDSINYTQYGGYADLDFAALHGVYRAGALGSWGVGKIGPRWVFVDPLGKVALLRGLTRVSWGDSHSMGWIGSTQYYSGPTANRTWTQNLTTKYGSQTAWRTAIVNRLRGLHYNWMAYASDNFQGFNFPISTSLNAGYYANFQPYCQGATTADEAIHNLCISIPSALATALFGYRGFGDYLDPKYAQLVNSLPQWPSANPNIFYVGGDDGDFVSQGFGAGHWNETGFHEIRNNIIPHMGLLALFCQPTIASQLSYRGNTGELFHRVPFNGTNTWPNDPTVYCKKVLIDDLKAKYGTIAALNAAWGSNYTMFDPDGSGWGVGKGLADEDGRRPRRWLGSNSPSDIAHKQGVNNNFLDSTTWGLRAGTIVSSFTGTVVSQVKEDLDLNLYKQANAYLSAQSLKIKAKWPGAVYGGATGGMGGNGAPTRLPVLKAMGQWMDIMQGIGAGTPQALLQFYADRLGDIPMIGFIYYDATSADSDMFWSPQPPAGGWNGVTQATRGAGIASFINTMTALRLNGNYPFCGYWSWDLTSQMEEGKAWGICTWQDNFYDGRDYRTSIPDPYTPGVMTIPEDPNHGPYGDTITPIKNAHIAQFTTLQAQLGPHSKQPRSSPG